ncbi:SMP-30/gluconolactonase/LRE family protein [Pseudomonas reactans]|nr:SMP-30/gluconolactonase/LRE family protein [Pseudomonas reactans]
MDVTQSARHFAGVQATLGESPVWDAARQTLFYIDITAGSIFAIQPGDAPQEIYRSARRVGALALTRAGNLIFTEDAQVAMLDLPTRRVVVRSAEASVNPSYRYNDGACSPEGQFITGLMDEQHSARSGSLHCYGAEGEKCDLLTGVWLPNGIAWSADGGTIYFVDSVAQAIYQAPWPLSKGQPLQPRVFAHTPAELGRPDGIALDVDGNLWVCQFNGGCLLYYSASGQLLRKVELPVPRPTSCCFGGEDLMTLYITSARFGMSQEELRRYPLAGDIFQLKVDSPGLTPHCFDDGLWLKAAP